MIRNRNDNLHILRCVSRTETLSGCDDDDYDDEENKRVNIFFFSCNMNFRKP